MSTTYTASKYQAEVKEQGFEQPDGGTPYFYLQLQILHRVDAAGRPQDCPQYERTYRQYLGETGVGFRILAADLRALGVEVDELERLDPASADAINLVGRRIDVECAIESYNGRPVERWRVARERKKLSPAALLGLGEKFRASRQGNQTAAPQPEPNPPGDPEAHQS
jgi:hypothetical protein